MHSRLLMSILVVGVAGSLMLTGCSGTTKNNGGDAPTATAAATAKKEKPPLEIPATFADDNAKRDFAYQAIHDGYYKEASDLLTQMTATNPTASDLAKLGTAEYNLHQYDQAIANWTKAEALDPTLTATMTNNIGNAYRDNNKPTKAEEQYRKALQLDPTLEAPVVNLASLLKDQGRLEEAVALVDTATKENPAATNLAEFAQSLKQTHTN